MPQFWSNSYNYESIANNANRNINYIFIGSDGNRIRTANLINDNAITTILDYGCGYSNSIQCNVDRFKDRLVNKNVQISKYDPFVPEYSTYPNTTFDYVICYNVLQFVEVQFIKDVVQDIANLSNKLAMFSIVIPPFITSNGITSNTDPFILKYIEAIQSANLTILDFKFRFII